VSSACRSLPRAASAARLVALAAALALACGRQSTYEVHGVVREVDFVAKQATIEHEDIPGLMSAMTMGFDVPDPAVLAKLRPGERVVFELEVTDKSFRIVSVQDGEAAPRAGAARSASSASIAHAGDLAPDFSLTDQGGARVSSAALRGRFALVDFIYTRCTGPCPILTSLQVELQRRLAPEQRERVHFVSITLDPAFDTPAVLAEYARARGADLATWSFLTGPPDEVADVVKRFGVGTLRAADGQIDHVVATFLLDPQGRIVQRWLGLENGVEERRAEIADLLGPPAAGS
jgi:protein SCO1